MAAVWGSAGPDSALVGKVRVWSADPLGQLQYSNTHIWYVKLQGFTVGR
jgi:hypothetical protein